MALIAHGSDTHGRPSIIGAIADLKADALLLTGDCIQNKGRVRMITGWSTEMRIWPMLEIKYQNRWFRKQAKKWAKALDGRPVITVGGNHCFISPARWLRHYGVTVYEITKENPSFEMFGKTWAGFREVPHMMDEWVGETYDSDFDAVIQRALDCNPDILITHAPPAGILDCGDGEYDRRGISKLTTALANQPHNITHHFFGHAHFDGGKVVDEMGVRFVNGAGHLIAHDIG